MTDSANIPIGSYVSIPSPGFAARLALPLKGLWAEMGRCLGPGHDVGGTGFIMAILDPFHPTGRPSQRKDYTDPKNF